jgi:O-antigen ligase
LTSFAFFCFGALGVIRRMSPRQIAWMVFLSSACFLILGIVSEVYFGTYRFSPRSTWYRFSGAWHPNLQGMNCALLTMSAVALADRSTAIVKAILYSCAAVGFSYLVLTRSRTSFAACVLALVAYKLISSNLARRLQLSLLALSVVLVFFLLAGESAIPLIQDGVLLGRSSETGASSLLGRIPLWNGCLPFVFERPFLGHGFNGFWTAERIASIAELQGWGLGSGHSVYLDVALELGLVGLTVFLAALVIGLVRASWSLKGSKNDETGFFFCFLVFYLLHGLLESIFLSPGYFSFLSLVVLGSLALWNGEWRRDNNRLS